MISVGIRQRMKTYGISRLPWPARTPEHRLVPFGKVLRDAPGTFRDPFSD